MISSAVSSAVSSSVSSPLGVPLQALTRLQVDVPGGRNRRVQLGGLTLLDETYNASPEAVLAALDLLAVQPGRHFAVLGTMLELGEQSEALHRCVAQRALDCGLDGLVVVASGAEARAMAAAAAGLPELITTTPAQLGAIRNRIAATIGSSALYDTARHCRHLETAYTTIWQRHLRGEAQLGFNVQ